tara:strand:+ start:810 stop:1292 length:483 start_codon:yes stop_codon:yes gene_type:complete
MMLNKILIYLLGFIFLIMIFLTVNYTKITDLNISNSKNLNKKIDSLKKSYELLDKKFKDEIYFSLDDNQEALKYFNDFEIDSLSLYIKDQLYEKNFIKNSDFFVPVSNADNKYLINKIKILNHKWIIADFSNGSRWGEMWIEFYFNKNEIVFNVKDYFLY